MRERLLDAAIESASLFGLSKLSMSDVARRAGVSRPTLYKHFGSKDELVAAAVGREAERLIESVLAALDGVDAFDEALEIVVRATLVAARSHPLLDRIVRTEPEALVPFLVSDDAGRPVGLPGVVTFVRNVIEAFLAESGPIADDVSSRRFADMVARLLVSFAISAPDDPPEVVARSVSTILLHGAAASAVDHS